ncbi:MAG: PEP-CTERM sorting domain-containing protein [Spartobacteria bacterium]|nr:PEP-CTERM sorting domain-containing protein [Spartobacteria bacterium]
MKKILTAIATVVLMTGSVFASIGSDNSSNYSDGWADGSNEGSGFGAWSFTRDAGFWIPASSDIEGFNAGIYQPDSAFALNYNSEGNYLNANRSITEWGNGYTFSMDLATHFRSGARGIDLKSVDSTLWNFNVTDTGYGDTGWEYRSDMLMNLSAVQNGGNVDITLNGSSVIDTWSDTYTTSVAGTLDGFSMYVSATSNEGDQSALLFNNLQVVPEPTSMALLGFGMLAIGLVRRRRNK